MRKRCLRNLPFNEPKIVIETWHLKACDGNSTAAALLSFFEYWHEIKLEMQKKVKRSNDIAEMHGDERSQDESLYQFHSEEELIEGILIAKRDAIRKGISLLQEKQFISVHKNPNPRYAFDRTRYFLFHTETVDEWLANYGLSDIQLSKSENQPRSLEKPSRQAENQSPSSEINSAITVITSETSSVITSYSNSPPTPQGEAEGCKAEKQVKEEEPSDTHLPSLSKKAEGIPLTKDIPETKDSAAPCDNSVFVGNGNTAPDGKQRPFDQRKATWKSVGTDPWMASGSNPVTEFKQWLYQQYQQKGKSLGLADAASEIRNDYARASDLWAEYQDELIHRQQAAERLKAQPTREVTKTASPISSEFKNQFKQQLLNKKAGV